MDEGGATPDEAPDDAAREAGEAPARVEHGAMGASLPATSEPLATTAAVAAAATSEGASPAGPVDATTSGDRTAGAPFALASATLRTATAGAPLEGRLTLFKVACGLVGAMHQRGEVDGALDPDRFHLDSVGGGMALAPAPAEAVDAEGAFGAPELAGRQPGDPGGASESSDIYSLGRILATLTAGATEATNEEGGSHTQGRRDRIAAVIARATRLDPAQRHVSVRELIADLDGPRSTSAPRPDPATRPAASASSSARRPADRAAGWTSERLARLVLVAAMATGAGFVAARIVRERRSGTPPPAPPAASSRPTPGAAPSPMAGSTPIAGSRPAAAAPQVPPGPCRQRTTPCPPLAERDPRGMEFVRVCAGVLCMGADQDDPQAQAQERPVHPVALPELWLGKYEVSNREYRWLVKDWPGADALPATGVSWDEADRFCRALGHRLPSEAEWEYAARGTDGRRYPWGNGGPDGERAVFDAPAGRPSAVDGVPGGEGPFGARHQAGNVSEWVADCYRSRAYAERLAAGDVDPAPRGTADCFVRSVRGGSFRDPGRKLRTTARLDASRIVRAAAIGFRCAR